MCASVCVCGGGTDVAAVVALGVISVAYGDTEWKMGAVRDREREQERLRNEGRNDAQRWKEDGVDAAIKQRSMVARGRGRENWKTGASKRVKYISENLLQILPVDKIIKKNLKRVQVYFPPFISLSV